ncbi:MAG: hypothetical protein HPY71_12980 [Firmicutes bacterium]|nr:hypothetical protein [Bacillota bacterium]
MLRVLGNPEILGMLKLPGGCKGAWSGKPTNKDECQEDKGNGERREKNGERSERKTGGETPVHHGTPPGSE